MHVCVYVHIHICLYKCYVYIHLCNTYLQDTYMHSSFIGSHAETCNMLRKTACECVLHLVYSCKKHDLSFSYPLFLMYLYLCVSM